MVENIIKMIELYDNMYGNEKEKKELGEIIYNLVETLQDTINAPYNWRECLDTIYDYLDTNDMEYLKNELDLYTLE